MASSVLIRVGFDENKTSSSRDITTASTISVAQKEHKSDTSDGMSSSEKCAPEEIPHASTSTLALPSLESLLAQQGQRSKEALESALAKKQEVRIK